MRRGSELKTVVDGVTQYWTTGVMVDRFNFNAGCNIPSETSRHVAMTKYCLQPQTAEAKTIGFENNIAIDSSSLSVAVIDRQAAAPVAEVASGCIEDRPTGRPTDRPTDRVQETRWLDRYLVARS